MIRFKPTSDAASVIVTDGEYRREFDRAKQPFPFVDEQAERLIFKAHPFLEIADGAASSIVSQEVANEGKNQKIQEEITPRLPKRN